MNREIAILREAVVKLTRMLTKMGLVVTQQGSNAYVTTDTKTLKPVRVNIPNIPHIPDNATQELILAIQGFIDHEVAHVLFTDWSIVQKAYALDGLKGGSQGSHAMLHNIFEDTFIERMIQKKFPGSAFNMSSLHRFFVEKITMPALQAAGDDEKRQLSVLLVPIARAWSGQQVFIDFLKSYDNQILPMTKAFLKAVPADIVARVPKIASSAQALEISEALHLILYPPAPPQPKPQPKPEPEPLSAPSDCEDHKNDDESEDQSNEPSEGEGEPSEADQQDQDDESQGAAGDDQNENEDDAEASGQSDEDEEPASDEDEEHGEGEGSPDGADGDGKDEDEEAGSKGAGDADEDEDAESDGAGAQAGDDDMEDDADDEAGSSATQQEDQDEADDASGDASDDAAADDEAGEDEDDSGSAGTSPADPEDGDEEEQNGASGAGENVDEADDEGEAQAEGERDEGDGGDAYDFGNALDPEEDAMDFNKSISRQIADDSAISLSGASYKAYTKDYDRIEIIPVPKDFDKAKVTQLEDETRHMVAPMQKEIERLLASQSRVVNLSGYRSGRLSAPNLFRLQANDDRVFSRRHENHAKRTAVVLLCDNSGSMYGRRQQIAMSSAFALAQTLERVNMPSQVMGYTTGNPAKREGMPAMDYAKILEEVRQTGIEYSRYEPIYMPIYKAFGERLTPAVRERFAFGAYKFGGSANIDGEAVELAALELAKRNEDRKVIFVLSDGLPSAGVDRDLRWHLRDVAKRLPQMGIEVIGIGINTDAVKTFYPRNVVLKDVSRLPQTVMGELRRVLTAR